VEETLREKHRETAPGPRAESVGEARPLPQEQTGPFMGLVPARSHDVPIVTIFQPA